MCFLAFRNAVQPSDSYFFQGAIANNLVGVRGYILELIATGGEKGSVLSLSIRLPLNGCRYPTPGAMASDELHTVCKILTTSLDTGIVSTTPKYVRPISYYTSGSAHDRASALANLVTTKINVSIMI